VIDLEYPDLADEAGAAPRERVKASAEDDVLAVAPGQQPVLGIAGEPDEDVKTLSGRR
jgi:hypothetical protein